MIATTLPELGEKSDLSTSCCCCCLDRLSRSRRFSWLAGAHRAPPCRPYQIGATVSHGPSLSPEESGENESHHQPDWRCPSGRDGLRLSRASINSETKAIKRSESCSLLAASHKSRQSRFSTAIFHLLGRRKSRQNFEINGNRIVGVVGANVMPIPSLPRSVTSRVS